MQHEVTDVPAMAQQRRRLWRIEPVPAMAMSVIIAALVTRVAFLGNQSYWTDELFSVNQAAGSLRHLLSVGRMEIHTPLYATLLWVWEKLGGTSMLWTHSLSGLFGLAAIVVTYIYLRPTPLSDTARWVAVATTAGNGFGIVYSQESRPYALVLLGATGLTAATNAQLIARPQRPVRAGVTWLAWATLTATAHLLGAILVGAMGLLLVMTAIGERRFRVALAQFGLALLAMVPQLVWIAAGLGRNGFAAGTTWITAPDQQDVWSLLTTVFSSGGLEPRADGFAWTSLVGLAVVFGLLVVALILQRGRRDYWTPDAAAGAGLFILGVATLLATMAVSLGIHVWTLRNMIILVPALTWGAAWQIIGLPSLEPLRNMMGAAILVALVASQPVLAASLKQPYKTDWRGLVSYLVQEREAQPEVTFSFFGNGPREAFVAVDDVEPTSLQRIYDRVDLHHRSASAIAGLHRLVGPQVVVFYAGVAHPQPVAIVEEIRSRLADPSCHSIPIYGFAVVGCGVDAPWAVLTWNGRCELRHRRSTSAVVLPALTEGPGDRPAHHDAGAKQEAAGGSGEEEPHASTPAPTSSHSRACSSATGSSSDASFRALRASEPAMTARPKATVAIAWCWFAKSLIPTTV